MTPALHSSSVALRCRRLSASICGSKVLAVLLLFPFFKTSLFDYYGGLSMYANAMLVVETVCFAVLFLASGFRSKLMAFITIYFVWDLIAAPLLGGTEAPSIYYCMQALGFGLYVMLGLKTNPRKSMSSLSFVFCAAAVINFLVLLAYPHGLVETLNGSLWLFGIRTGFSLVLIPGLCFCLLSDSFGRRGSFGGRTWIMIFVTIATLVNQWVATGIVELIVLALLYVWVKLRGSINARLCTAVIAAATVAILFLGPSTIFGDFVDALGKDMTLSGRTEIWATVMLAISQQPWFGYGSVSWVLVNNERWACHDLWLNIAHESGLIGLALYICMFVYSAICLDKTRDTGAGRIISIFFLAVLVASVVEIQTYFPFIYGLLAAAESIASDVQSYGQTTYPVPMKLR